MTEGQVYVTCTECGKEFPETAPGAYFEGQRSICPAHTPHCPVTPRQLLTAPWREFGAAHWDTFSDCQTPDPIVADNIPGAPGYCAVAEESTPGQLHVMVYTEGLGTWWELSLTLTDPVPPTYI